MLHRHTKQSGKKIAICVDLPVYEQKYSNEEAGEYMMGGFYMVCSIILNGETMSGWGYAVKKKNAEKLAAQMILSKMEENDKSMIQYIPGRGDNGYMVVYLDMENINVNNLRRLFKYYRYDSGYFLFVGCLSTGHHYATTEFGFEDIAFQKVLVPSTR